MGVLQLCHHNICHFRNEHFNYKGFQKNLCWHLTSVVRRRWFATSMGWNLKSNQWANEFREKYQQPLHARDHAQMFGWLAMKRAIGFVLCPFRNETLLHSFKNMRVKKACPYIKTCYFEKYANFLIVTWVVSPHCLLFVHSIWFRSLEYSTDVRKFSIFACKPNRQHGRSALMCKKSSNWIEAAHPTLMLWNHVCLSVKVNNF